MDFRFDSTAARLIAIQFDGESCRSKTGELEFLPVDVVHRDTVTSAVAKLAFETEFVIVRLVGLERSETGK